MCIFILTLSLSQSLVHLDDFLMIARWKTHVHGIYIYKRELWKEGLSSLLERNSFRMFFLRTTITL